MKYCPKCTKEYNINTKVCPLDHCPNCGSLELKRQLSREYRRYGFSNIVTAGIFIVIFGGMFTALTFASGIVYGFIGLSILIAISTMLVLSQTKPNFMCTSCKAKKFTPDNLIKLHYKDKQKTGVNNTSMTYEPEQNDISKKFDEFSEVQKEHHKRDFILRIVGIVIGAIFGIVGLIYSGLPLDFLSEIWK